MGMEIACYYTLSTISQTLAVAFGFLLAVVVYRMQAIGNGLPGKTGAFEEIPPLASQRPPFLELRRRGDWAGYIDLATRKLDEIKSVEDREKAVTLLREIKADVNTVGAIKSSLEWSLRWTSRHDHRVPDPAAVDPAVRGRSGVGADGGDRDGGGLLDHDLLPPHRRRDEVGQGGPASPRRPLDADGGFAHADRRSPA